jgi:hypothetical protein
MITNLATALAVTATLGAAPAQPPVGNLPGTSAKVMAELAGRPIQLTAYLTPSTPPMKERVWDPAGRAFVEIEGEAAVSPDERWAATLAGGFGKPTMAFVDRKSGHRTTVELPVRPIPGRKAGTCARSGPPGHRTAATC